LFRNLNVSRPSRWSAAFMRCRGFFFADAERSAAQRLADA